MVLQYFLGLMKMASGLTRYFVPSFSGSVRVFDRGFGKIQNTRSAAELFPPGSKPLITAVINEGALITLIFPPVLDSALKPSGNGSQAESILYTDLKADKYIQISSCPGTASPEADLSAGEEKNHLLNSNKANGERQRITSVLSGFFPASRNSTRRLAKQTVSCHAQKTRTGMPGQTKYA